MTMFEPFTMDAAGQDVPWATLAGGDRTGGLVTFGQAHLAPRTAGPPRHVHTNEDEAIFVFAGVLTVEVGDRRIEAGPHSLTWLPREVPHVFANLSDEDVWALGVSTPAGLEEMFETRDRYLTGLDGPPDIEVILELNRRYGVRPVEGPPLI
jgi:mannose-6-phosphate isomerase-like protein (cupin superfamily)